MITRKRRRRRRSWIISRRRERKEIRARVKEGFVVFN